MTALSDRVEAASADEQRAMLEAAFVAIHGDEPPSEYDGLAWKQNNPDFSPAWTTYISKRGQFQRLLDAEAYESAAMMLVPEEWSVRVGRFDDGTGYAGLAKNDMHMGAEDPDEWYWECENAATPTLALTAACLRARGL